MNRMRAVAVGILASSALACGALVVAQQQSDIQHPQAIETSRQSRLTGVNVVRLINTAEMDYKYAHGKYATWDELFRSGAISDRERPATKFQGLKLSLGPEVVPGWALSLVTAAEGQNYELSLKNSADACGFAFFSDQSGLIYQGGVIGCSVDLRPQS